MLTIALAIVTSPFGAFLLCCLITTMVVDWKQESDDSSA